MNVVRLVVTPLRLFFVMNCFEPAAHRGTLSRGTLMGLRSIKLRIGSLAYQVDIHSFGEKRSQVPRIFTAMLTTVFVLVTGNAHAVGWGNTVTITNLQSNTGGNFYINTSANQNPDNCGSSAWLIVSDLNYKFVISMVLAAQASGQSVALYYNGCASGYPNITAVAIPNL